MSRSPGQRIGAILSAKDGVVQFLGYGVYDGDHQPPAPVGMMRSLGETWEAVYAEAKETWGYSEEEARDNLPLKNPRLTLDNGAVVWGAECWWGGEEKVRQKLEASEEIIEVDPRTVPGLQANRSVN